MTARTGVMAGFIMWAGGAFAASPQGIDLARDCRATGAIEQARCASYVSGFISGSQVNFNGTFFNEWRYGDSRWCFDESVSDDTLIKAFLDHAAAHTGELHFPAATVFAKAMAVAYRCK